MDIADFVKPDGIVKVVENGFGAGCLISDTPTQGHLDKRAADDAARQAAAQARAAAEAAKAQAAADARAAVSGLPPSPSPVQIKSALEKMMAMIDKIAGGA